MRGFSCVTYHTTPLRLDMLFATYTNPTCICSSSGSCVWPSGFNIDWEKNSQAIGSISQLVIIYAAIPSSQSAEMREESKYPSSARTGRSYRTRFPEHIGMPHSIHTAPNHFFPPIMMDKMRKENCSPSHQGSQILLISIAFNHVDSCVISILTRHFLSSVPGH